jgi:hypothetical protein
MKKALFLLLFVHFAFQVFSQEPYIKPYSRKYFDSLHRDFNVTNKKISGLQMSLAAGAYVPFGGLSVIGPHVSFGISGGWRFNKFMVDIDLGIRYKNAATRNFIVNYKDTLYLSGNYLGGSYVGLDIGYELGKKGKHEWDILAGGGIDMFSSTFDHGKDTAAFKTFNVNLGLGYKLFLTHIRKGEYPRAYYRRDPSQVYRRINKRQERYSYLAFQVKYNFLKYNNPGGSDFSGNAATIAIIYGLYGH